MVYNNCKGSGLYSYCFMYVKNLEIGRYNSLYGALLTERQREFIRLYYDCDVSLSEISEMSGISRQAVRDAILRGERELIRLEEVLGFREKIDEITELCGKDGGKLGHEILELLEGAQ